MLGTTLLAYQAAVLRTAQTEIEIREWSDGQYVYRLTEDGYECTTGEHDGYPWADRVTGRGATQAKAQDNLFDVLREWNS